MPSVQPGSTRGLGENTAISLTDDAWSSFHARSLLGASLLGQQRFAEAEPLRLAGYEGLRSRAEKLPLEDKPLLKEALQRIVQLYEASGKAAQAADWKRRLDCLK